MKLSYATAAALGVLGFAAPAFAADLPAQVYTKAPPLEPAVYDWTGVYVGAFGGGGYGNHNLINALGPAANTNFTVNYSSTGGLAGGLAGYNWQSGNYVFGMEGDFAWFDIKGNDAFALGSNDATSLRWAGTVRLRSGFAIDRFLMFFTAGGAYGQFQHTNTAPGIGVDQFTVERSGWTAGGGIEYAVTQNLLAKFEYRYTNFGAYDRFGSPLTPNGQLPFTVRNTYSDVLLGLSYKFGGPVVARF